MLELLNELTRKIKKAANLSEEVRKFLYVESHKYNKRRMDKKITEIREKNYEVFKTILDVWQYITLESEAVSEVWAELSNSSFENTFFNEVDLLNMTYSKSEDIKTLGFIPNMIAVSFYYGDINMVVMAGMIKKLSQINAIDISFIKDSMDKYFDKMKLNMFKDNHMLDSYKIAHRNSVNMFDLIPYIQNDDPGFLFSEEEEEKFIEESFAEYGIDASKTKKISDKQKPQVISFPSELIDGNEGR